MAWSPRRVFALVVGAAAVLVPAGLAWGCVGVVSLTTSSPTVQPGGTLTVTGREFAAKVPVDIHLDSATGPVLVTVPGPSSTMNSKFTATVPIPGNIQAGEHVLFASQDHHDMNSGQPARAVFYVGVAPPAPAGAQARPVGMESASGPSVASLVLIGLGVAIVALLVAGGLTLASAGRRPEGRPEVAR